MLINFSCPFQMLVLLQGLVPAQQPDDHQPVAAAATEDEEEEEDVKHVNQAIM